MNINIVRDKSRAPQIWDVDIESQEAYDAMAVGMTYALPGDGRRKLRVYNEIRVGSQKEWDALPDMFAKRTLILVESDEAIVLRGKKFDANTNVHLRGSTYAIFKDTQVFVFDDTTAFAHGKSTVIAYDRATVNLFNKSRGYGCGESKFNSFGKDAAGWNGAQNAINGTLALMKKK